MRSVFAQAETSFFDNGWPETFRFPFGEWIKQLIFWAVNNPVTSTIGEIVEWPFRTLFELIMSDQVGRDSIETVPWVWLVVAVFVVASFTRNTRVGLACAAMLAVCGFLGAEYWAETAKTIGMILVSVTLCAIVGIPLGILSGRFDAVWNVVRPTLDAMQVVHSFVFMLPFIFFFGIGEVSATMVTMVFALPPLVRLTNLGIRQVPEDVVEASRAYGATELRVLTDVQLPLARPAIMTGLNQTLLLAISMLGIAALMGAGGLGRLLFRAINNLNLGLAASGGLAFFLVAVILDRISQTEEQDGVSLFVKVRQAWTFRAEPELLLEAQAAQAVAPVEEEEPDERPSPVEASERLGLTIGAVGGLLAIVSVFLTWGSNAGKIAAWARFADENVNGELQGMSFNGFQASGGSIFGVIVAIFGLLAVLAAVRPMLSFGPGIPALLVKAQGALLAAIGAIIVVIWLLNIFGVDSGPLSGIGLSLFALTVALIAVETFMVGTPRLGADGVMMAGFAVFVSALAYLTMNGSEFLTGYSDGIGLYLAVIAGLVILAGGAIAVFAAPYGPRRPLPVDASWGKVIGSVFALLLIVGSAFGVGDAEKKTEYGWLFDQRIEAIERSSGEVPADIQAEIDRLREEAGDDINKQIANAQAITNLINSVQTGDKIVHSGVNGEGPALGWLAMIMAALAVAVSFAAAGAGGIGENQRWQASVLLAGLGLGIMAYTAAFIVSLVRVAEGVGVLAGIGAFVTFVAGFIIFSSGRSVVGEFRRRKVYAEYVHDHSTDTVIRDGVGDQVDVAMAGDSA
jgi:glycine betaine/proline transport system permease protein